MFITATPSPYQRATRYQRLGFPEAVSPFNRAAVGFEDLIQSLTKAAYEEELQRRERAAFELKRKRQEEQERQNILVRHLEHDDFFQIQILKPVSRKNNFKNYLIRYFKKCDQVLLNISSENDRFNQDFKYDPMEIDERNINYKVLDQNRLLVITVPKKNYTEIDEERIFNCLLYKQSQQEASLRQQRLRQLQNAEREKAQRLEQIRQARLRQVRERQLIQERERQLALREQREQKIREQAQARERFLREQRQEREQQVNLQRERQLKLQEFFNTLIQSQLAKPTQVPVIRTDDFVIPVDINSDEDSDSLSTPEASDSESDTELSQSDEDQDPEISDISDVLETNTLKDADESAVESDSELEDESVNKKRRLRSPSIEEVEDEEFTRWL